MRLLWGHLSIVLLILSTCTPSGAGEAMANFPFYPSLINTRTGEPVNSTEFFPPFQVKPWEIERFNYNTTIPPKGFADREFACLIPAHAGGGITATVKLRYRGYPQKVGNRLLGDDAPVLPIVDMAEVRASVPVK